jgi:hypothetical protein
MSALLYLCKIKEGIPRPLSMFQMWGFEDKFMTVNVKKNYAINLNRIIIFILIVVGVTFDSDVCAILAAAYWLWLPYVEKFEFSILKMKVKS